MRSGIFERHALQLALLSCTAGLAPKAILAQDAKLDSSTARVLAAQKELEEHNKVFKFGLSVGWRHLLGNRSEIARDAVLHPADSTVQVEQIDQGDVVLSGVVVAFPWKKPLATPCCTEASGLWRLGFIANIALASFSNDEVATFNRSIEGGGGVAVRLADDFSLALTLERVFSRRLRGFVKRGERLPVGPKEDRGAFTRDNGTYFFNDNLSALSFKFVYFFR